MAVALDPVKVALFKELFDKPSIDAISQLSPPNAEKFIQNVFESAGFLVNDVHTVHYPEGPGVDLTLHLPHQSDLLAHGVEVKRWATPVGPEPVQAFAWKMQQQNATGYFMAIRGFTPAARAVAVQDKNIHLIDGEHLLRYIAYVSRSRVDRVYANIKLPLAEPAGPVWLLRADALMSEVLQPPKRARILAIANNKGGVGKSTTARCVALALEKRGKRALLVDMDAQANLTEFLLGDEVAESITPTLAGYFAGVYPLNDTMCEIPGHKLLKLIPGHLDLGMLDTGGAGHPGIELRFAGDLYQLAASQGPGAHMGFDWIILDTPPAISLYTRTALAVADLVVAPARARGSSASGTRNALYVRQAMNGLVGRSNTMLGCVATHWQNDERSRNARFQLEFQLNGLGGHMFKTTVPLSVAVENPQPPSAVLQAYDALVEEVLKDVDGN